MQPPSHRRDAALWMAGIGVLVACSWVRFVATGLPKVDENDPTRLMGGFLLVTVIVGWGLMVAGWYGFLVRPVAKPRRLAFTGMALASVMLPLLSNDIFSVMAYGSLAARGTDVYTTAAHLPQSPYFSWIGTMWNDMVCVYGPVSLTATTPVALAHGSIWGGIIALHAVWLVPVIIAMELSFRWMPDKISFHTWVWLNPLWVLEGPGHLHTDMLGMLALVFGMLAQQRGKPVTGWACWALATLGKYSFFFAGPWFWLYGARTSKERWMRLPAMAAILVGLGVTFFVPFWNGLASFTYPIHALASMNAGGTVAEVIGDLVFFAKGGKLLPPDTDVHQVLAYDHATKGWVWAIVNPMMRALAVAVCLRVFAAILRKPEDQKRLALGTGAIVVAAVTLASHRFQAWYLLAALPFFGLAITRAWQKWWVFMVAMSVTPDFLHLVPRGSLPIWAAFAVGGSVVLFLSWIWGRYVTFDADAEPLTTPVDDDDAPRGATAQVAQ